MVTRCFLAVNTCFMMSSDVSLRCRGLRPGAPRIGGGGGLVPSASSGNGTREADPDVTRIGVQLRAARLASRKSMAEVAEQAGLTKGFLSKLERDLANVSVPSLTRLWAARDVSVGSLCRGSKGGVVGGGPSPPINF